MSRSARRADGARRGMFRDAAALDAALAALPQDAFVVAFFLHALQVSQDEWMAPLARHLRKAGFVTVGITTPQSAGQCRLDGPEYQAVVPLADIPRLTRVNVFIISDVDCLEPHFPQESRVLACCHGVLTTSDTAYAAYLHHIGLVDGWLCSCPITPRSRELVTSLWKGLADSQYSRRKNRHLHFIPMGYPRLAALAEKLDAQPCRPDAIVYAPTILDYHPEIGGQRVKSHGARILRVLLQNFPDYRVVFRPYKSDLDHPVVTALHEQFRHEPRFIFDAAPERLFSFAHGATLVTDISHISASFAYVTLRAPVHFRPWQQDGPDVSRTDGSLPPVRIPAWFRPSGRRFRPVPNWQTSCAPDGSGRSCRLPRHLPTSPSCSKISSATTPAGTGSRLNAVIPPFFPRKKNCSGGSAVSHRSSDLVLRQPLSCTHAPTVPFSRHLPCTRLWRIFPAGSTIPGSGPRWSRRG